MTAPNGDVAEILRRIAEDPAFLAQLNADPTAALSGYDLSPADLQQVQAAISPLDGGSPLFECNESAATPTSRKVPFIVAGAVLLAAGAGALIGFVGFGGSTPQPTGLEQQGNSVVTTSPTPSDVPTASEAPTVTASAAASPTATASAMATVSPSAAPASATPSASASTTPSPTPSPTPSKTASPTRSPSPKPLPNPTVGSVSANPGNIWESGPKGYCASTTTSKVTVPVSDAAGLSSVTMSWSVNATNGSTPMTAAGSTYEAVLGSFKAGTVAAAGDSIGVVVKAVDKGGRTSSTSTKGFLYSASTC